MAVGTPPTSTEEHTSKEDTMQLRDAGDGITRDSLAFYRDHRHELGALREVTVRFPAFDDPYNPYLMVLRDADGQELLLSGCTAGYVGEGPHGTLQVLVAEGCPVDAATYVLDGAALRYTRDGDGDWHLGEYHSAREHCRQQLDGYDRGAFAIQPEALGRTR